MVAGVEGSPVRWWREQQGRTVAQFTADLARGVVVDGEDESGEAFGGGGIEEVAVDGGHFGGRRRRAAVGGSRPVGYHQETAGDTLPKRSEDEADGRPGI